MADTEWHRPQVLVQKPKPAPVAPRPWSSRIPPAFAVRAKTGLHHIDSAINGDAMLALNSDRYARARATYIDELRKPVLDRRALDRAVEEVLLNFGAAISRVGEIGLEVLTREVKRVVEQRDGAISQRDNAIEQLLALKQ